MYIGAVGCPDIWQSRFDGMKSSELRHNTMSCRCYTTLRFVITHCVNFYDSLESIFRHIIDRGHEISGRTYGPQLMHK